MRRDRDKRCPRFASQQRDRAVHHVGGSSGLLLLEQIQPLIGAQASCLWGNRASHLVIMLFVGGQDARRPHSQDGCVTLHL